jgi:hypothetical protein
MAHCLWNDFEGHIKHPLANWHLVSMKKDLVVLVSTNLRDVNLCLLGSLIKGYHNDEGKIWKSIVDSKCIIDSPNLFARNQPHTS